MLVPVYSWSIPFSWSLPLWPRLICFLPAWCSCHRAYPRRLEQCGHGLSSRPRESSVMLVVHALFLVYLDGAAAELFNGTSKLRHSSAPFS